MTALKVRKKWGVSVDWMKEKCKVSIGKVRENRAQNMGIMREKRIQSERWGRACGCALKTTQNTFREPFSQFWATKLKQHLQSVQIDFSFSLLVEPCRTFKKTPPRSLCWLPKVTTSCHFFATILLSFLVFCSSVESKPSKRYVFTPRKEQTQAVNHSRFDRKRGLTRKERPRCLCRSANWPFGSQDLIVNSPL